MGLLDSLFLPQALIDPRDAHRGALSDLLLAAANPPLQPTPFTTETQDAPPATPRRPMASVFGDGPEPLPRYQPADPVNDDLFKKVFGGAQSLWEGLGGETATPSAPQTQEAQAQPVAPTQPQALLPWAATTEQAPAPSPVMLGPWATSLQANPAADAGVQAPAMAQPPSVVSPSPAAGGNPAQPPVQVPPMREIGIMDRLGAMGRGFSEGGLLGGIAAAAGARSPLEIEDQNQTYKALVAKGVDPELAKAAVLNPDVARQVIAQAFGPKQFTTTGVDPWGNEQRGFVDPYAMTVTAPKGAQSALQGPGGIQDVTNVFPRDVMAVLSDPAKSPAEKLAVIPAGQRDLVKAMLDGRESVGQAYRAKPAWLTLTAIANMVDPHFAQFGYEARAALQKNLAGYGKGGQESVSLNTALEHIEPLSDSIQNLHNFQSAGVLNRSLNSVRNFFKEQYGDPNLADFEYQKQVAASEIDKAYKAAGGGEGEREKLMQSFSAARTPAELNQLVARATKDLMGKSDQLQKYYQRNMGPAASSFDVLDEGNRRILNKVYSRAGWDANGNPAAQQTQQQAAPLQRVASFEDALKLPSGTVFMTPDGRFKVRP